MHNNHTKITFLAIWIFLTINVFAAENISEHIAEYPTDKIEVLTEQYFPWNYTLSGKNNDAVIGIATEIVSAVLKEAKVPFSIKIVPWPRAIQKIDTKVNVLVYSMFRTQEREDKYYWVGKIIDSHVSLYALKRNAMLLPTSLKEARTSRIAVGRGSAIHNYLKHAGFSNLIVLNSKDRIFLLLKNDRIDFMEHDETTFASFARRAGYNSTDFTQRIRLSGVTEQIYLALSKKTNDSLVIKITNAYKTIVTNGTYANIIKKLE